MLLENCRGCAPYFLKTGVQKRNFFTILSENSNLARRAHTVFAILFEHGVLARTVFYNTFHANQAACRCKLQAASMIIM